MGKEPPLTGLKVVELARILAGPWAGQVLADLGAEVIKVESPEGDDTRKWGPPFVDNPDDLAVAIEAAARGALEMAAESPLLHAVLSSSQGAESDLLPLLTTHSAPVLSAAGGMIRAHVATYDVDLPDERLESLIDMVVRLVISHVMQPAASPAETAATISWIAARVLGKSG